MSEDFRRPADLLTPGMTLWLSTVSVLTLINYVTYAITIGLWLCLDASFSYGLYALIHIILYGTTCAFIPRSDDYNVNKSGNASDIRQARMAQQGGHSLMLAYFLGQAPLAELYRIISNFSSASLALLVNAFNMHASGIAMFKCLFTWWAISALAAVKTAAEQAAVALPAVADAAAMATDAVKGLAEGAKAATAQDVLDTLGLSSTTAAPTNMWLLECVVYASYVSFAIGFVCFLVCNLTNAKLAGQANLDPNENRNVNVRAVGSRGATAGNDAAPAGPKAAVTANKKNK